MTFDASYDMDRCAKWAAECRCNTTVDGINVAEKFIAKHDAMTRARNELYIQLRRDGKDADESRQIVADAAGVKVTRIELPIWSDDDGDIDELVRMYL